MDQQYFKNSNRLFANFIRLTERDTRGNLEDMSHMDMEELENTESI